MKLENLEEQMEALWYSVITKHLMSFHDIVRSIREVLFAHGSTVSGRGVVRIELEWVNPLSRFFSLACV